MKRCPFSRLTAHQAGKLSTTMKTLAPVFAIIFAAGMSWADDVERVTISPAK
jgi:hypothetical protein